MMMFNNLLGAAKYAAPSTPLMTPLTPLMTTAVTRRLFSNPNKVFKDTTANQAVIRSTMIKKGTNKNSYKKLYFKNVKYDQEGRFLVLHHMGAGKYYKMNGAFLLFFFGGSLYNYVNNSSVFFGKEWFGKLYLSIVGLALVGVYIFANRHIRCLYLLKGGSEVGIETYSNLGLTYNRLRVMPIS